MEVDLFEISGLIDRLTYSFKKWGYYKNYWCQLGLLHDDTYMELDNTGFVSHIKQLAFSSLDPWEPIR